MKISLPVPKLGDVLPLPDGGEGLVTSVSLGWDAVQGNFLAVEVTPVPPIEPRVLGALDPKLVPPGFGTRVLNPTEDFRGEDYPHPDSEALRLQFEPYARFRGKRRGNDQGRIGQDVVEPIEVPDRAALEARLTRGVYGRVIQRVVPLYARPTDGADYGWEAFAVIGDSGCVGYTDKPL